MNEDNVLNSSESRLIVTDTNYINALAWADGTILPKEQICVGRRGVYVHSELTGNDYLTGYAADRMIICLNIPAVPENAYIKNVKLTFCQNSSVFENGEPGRLCLYKYNYEDESYDPDLIDFKRMRSAGESDNEVNYSFDITSLAEQMIKNNESDVHLLLKADIESVDEDRKVILYGSSASNPPQLTVTYETSFGVHNSHRTDTHRISSIAQGNIDLVCGNLMFDVEDFAWSGNRMPVTLRHMYNSVLSDRKYTHNGDIGLNTADFSAFSIGSGWKLNLMQSMTEVNSEYYLYTDENGNSVRFNPKFEEGQSATTVYENEDDSKTVYNSADRTITMGDEIYTFDTSGRLISIADKHSSMTVTYTNNCITAVTDGAGRVFAFSYENGALTEITAPDGSKVSYTYSGNLLESVTYPDGKKLVFNYNSNNKPKRVIVKDLDDNEFYKTEYEFIGEQLKSVTEYGMEDGTFVKGASTAYTYSASSNRTIAETAVPADTDEGETENEVIKTVYTFDDDGALLSRYAYTEDTGNVGALGNASGINPYSDDSGANVIYNVNNLLLNHGFEAGGRWNKLSSSDSAFGWGYSNDAGAKYGQKCMFLYSFKAGGCTESGVYQQTDTLSKGEYTFSAYMKVSNNADEDPRGYIRVRDASGKTLGISRKITVKDTEYIRLTAPFALESSEAVTAEIVFSGKGVIYADAVQLEKNPFANDYNILENSDFEKKTNDWYGSAASYSADACFSGTRSLKIEGDITECTGACQTVKCKTEKGTRETFTLSGWAKGYAVPNGDSDDEFAPTFRLRAEVVYKSINGEDFECENFYADFSPCTDDWQFTSVEFAKSHYGSVDCIRIYCEYAYNFGNAYFDNLKLVRNSVETGLAESDFADTQDTEKTADSAETADSEDTAAEDTIPEFKEVTDAYGNTLTETTFADGEFGTIYRAFEYNQDSYCIAGNNAGNDLVKETDARGNATQYKVNDKTSRNEEVTDRLGNKTAYEYDLSGKTTKVTSKKADGTEIANVAYAYDVFDNMTEIVRGDGLKYVLKYNAFNNLESIGIDGKDDSLIKYSYKKGNGRLKEMTYANGDKMKAVYNGLGQLIAEKWYNDSETLTAHYKYVYDGQGNIVRSIDITALKEYNYLYENGLIVRSCEYDITLDDNLTVTAKTAVNTVKYYYDNEGNPVKKCICPENADEQVIYIEKDANESNVIKFEIGGKTVTSHSKTDTFGRKEFDEIQFSTGFASRKFEYLNGKFTDEHKNNDKLKSTPTTNLVSRITLSNGRTLDYEYDAEERITKVTDSAGDTTEYTYDELGQLLTETVNGAVKNTMTYDNYGNILSKNGVAYTYGDGTWKDLLKKVGDKTITYDAQGNPTNYLGKTLVWEKGRQLKSINNPINNDVFTFTYNANGIRTSKYVSWDGSTHKYTLDGTKILREEWSAVIEGTLVNYYIAPIYDKEDNVVGIDYCGNIYYFLKNLQGDVIEIINGSDGKTVAKYSYDAWGKCTTDPSSIDSAIAFHNPYRYRSYFYDPETELYYLQSRYYDPNTGRFINADESTYVAIDDTVLSCNIFMYCKNSLPSSLDSSGCNNDTITLGSYQWAYLISSVVPAVAAAKVGIIAAIKSALAFLLNVIAVVGLVLLVIIIIAAISVTAAKVLRLVQEAVKTSKYKGVSGYVVYVLTRKAGNPNTIFYVGRTKNFAKRMKAHAKNKKPCYGYVVVVCRTYAASRAIEQAVLSACIVSKVFAIDKGRIPNGSNRMRGIAKESVKNFKNNLSDLTSLMSCTSDSDLLNLMGS